MVEYAYDFGNRWVRKVLNPGEVDEESTIFVYDGNQIALQFDKTGTGDMVASNLTHRYLWGTSVDQILADEQVHYASGNFVTDEVLWPLTDHLGSVRDAVDNAGVVRIHRIYDAFGDITMPTVTTERRTTAAGQIVQPGQPGALLELLGFTARPFDPATGIQNNLHRWYDAAVGRWLSEDPIGFEAGDGNLYRYVVNSPIGATDPLGLGDTIEVRLNVTVWPSGSWWCSAPQEYCD